MKLNQIVDNIKLFLILVVAFISCSKESPTIQVDPSTNLSLDSIVPTKRNIITWEEIYITAYTKGKNISYNWSANHGSMLEEDSSTVTYWACPSCVGKNTIKCQISNEFGTISDTITITVTE
jgi:hypothetical protein